MRRFLFMCAQQGAAWTAAAALVGVGLNYLTRPNQSSRQVFGVPIDTSDERLYLLSKAARDVGLGLIAGALLVRREKVAAATALGIGAAGPLLDGALLLVARGPKPQLTAHWGVAALMGVAAWALAHDGQEPSG